MRTIIAFILLLGSMFTTSEGTELSPSAVIQTVTSFVPKWNKTIQIELTDDDREFLDVKTKSIWLVLTTNRPHNEVNYWVDQNKLWVYSKDRTREDVNIDISRAIIAHARLKEMGIYSFSLKELNQFQILALIAKFGGMGKVIQKIAEIQEELDWAPDLEFL